MVRVATPSSAKTFIEKGGGLHIEPGTLGTHRGLVAPADKPLMTFDIPLMTFDIVENIEGLHVDPSNDDRSPDTIQSETLRVQREGGRPDKVS